MTPRVGPDAGSSHVEILPRELCPSQLVIENEVGYTSRRELQVLATSMQSTPVLPTEFPSLSTSLERTPAQTC
jgi:hypothetical protein